MSLKEELEKSKERIQQRTVCAVSFPQFQSDAGVYDLTIKKAEKTRIIGVFNDPHLEKITKI